MNVVLSVIGFLIVLGPLVLIHEFGHFIALRLVGVTVLEFGFGFPPRARKLFEQGGTEFTLNWLPIGGFVRPLGEDFVKPVGDDATAEERAAFEQHQAELAILGKKRVKTKSVVEARPLERIFYLSAGAAMNFVGAFLILVFTALIGQPAQGVIILGNSPDSPASIVDPQTNAAKIQLQDVLLEVNGKAVLTVDEATAALKTIKGKLVELTVQRNGQPVKVTLDASYAPYHGIWIDSTSKGSPAEAALKHGDIVVFVTYNNVKHLVGSIADFKSYIDDHAGKSVVLTFLRDGKEQTAEITPRANPPQDEGRLGVSIVQITYNPIFGLGMADSAGGKIQKYSLAEAIPLAAQTTFETIGRTVSAPIEIISGRLKGAQSRLVSPVGIADISGQVLAASSQDQTPYRILNFIAVISIALGVTNLLPIPGLDGGRILFVLIELIRGKPIAPEREGMVHLIGLVFLLGLMAILVVQDVISPIGPIIPK